MKHLLTFAYLLLSLFPARSASAATYSLDDQMRALCAAIAPNGSFDYARFTSEFQAAVPESTTKAIFASLFHSDGRCTGVSSLAPTGAVTQFALQTDAGLLINGHIALDATGLIDRLRFTGETDPSLHIQSLDDVRIAMKSWPGNTGFAFVPGSGGAQTFNNDQAFALGSSFKLWVLGTLIDEIKSGRHSWVEPLTLREEWRSTGSGAMQTLPAGYAPSLFELAQKMISVSDNTAADHLVHLLGRDAITAMQTQLGVAPHPGNLPFLTTLDMFKLKWTGHPEIATQYIAADPATRLTLLDQLKSVPRGDICKMPGDCQGPRDIDSIEWFATPKEICSAMRGDALSGDSNARSILGLSTPMIDPNVLKHWQYVGYKGGSEPGVVTMVYWLESKSGANACFSALWNDPKAPVVEGKMFTLIDAVEPLLETLIP